MTLQPVHFLARFRFKRVFIAIQAILQGLPAASTASSRTFAGGCADLKSGQGGAVKVVNAISSSEVLCLVYSRPFHPHITV